MTEWDYFISHASEDKPLIAAPLAHLLREASFKVWYDDFALRVGDSLANTIYRGLRQSDYGIVILSPHFFAKSWPKRELEALTAREGKFFGLSRRRRQDRIILPIWYDVTADDVQRHAPCLVDRKSVTTARGLQAVAEEIVRATHPERLKDLPLTNVHDNSDHQQAQEAFRALLDRNPPLRDIRLFLSAYHSLLQRIVGYDPLLIPAYKLDCPIPIDFVELVPQGMTGGMRVVFITLGPLEGTDTLPQLLQAITTSLGAHAPLPERSEDTLGRPHQVVGNYRPLINVAQELRSLLAIDANTSHSMLLAQENMYWTRPQEWLFSFLVVAGRRRTKDIDKERENLLRSVEVSVEIASYDRLLD